MREWVSWGQKTRQRFCGAAFSVVIVGVGRGAVARDSLHERLESVGDICVEILRKRDGDVVAYGFAQLPDSPFLAASKPLLIRTFTKKFGSSPIGWRASSSVR